MGSLKALRQDFSLSAVVAGMIAVAVSYAGPAVIVFQAASVGHLTADQLSSWIWAISIGSGLTGIGLSLWFKAPIITAWSTPGAALLVTSLPQYGYADAIGAYLFSALLLTLFGVTGLFSRVMERIPKGIVAAMLAGILFQFGTGLFDSLKQLPVLVLPIIMAYLVGRRFFPQYAIVVTLLLGLCIAFGLNQIDASALSVELAIPAFTSPSFSLSALVGLGIPLCFVTMASQNAPGIAVLQTAGYRIPASPLVATTGIASFLLAPFGAHGINLAAITAAICTGPEAHASRNRRYIAGVACGAFYLIVGAFGATVAGVFSSLPATLIASLAGLALLGALTGGLVGALADETRREPALVTFLITASGISFFGVGAAFWGLLGGVLASGILFGSLRPVVKRRGDSVAKPDVKPEIEERT